MAMTRRSIVWTIAAVCLVAGLGALLLSANRVERLAAPSEAGVSSAAEPRESTKPPEPESSAPGASASEVAAAPVIESSQQPADIDPPKSRGSPAQISELELHDARTAVGRAFPLSVSLSRRCSQKEVTTSICDVIGDFLDRMKMERRDIVWAREMEERLEQTVVALDGGTFEIRAIECRSKRCAVEVAAIDNHYGGDIESDPTLDEELIRSTTMFASEKVSGGQERIVTVATFKRASAFEVRDGKLVEK